MDAARGHDGIPGGRVSLMPPQCFAQPSTAFEHFSTVHHHSEPENALAASMASRKDRARHIAAISFPAMPFRLRTWRTGSSSERLCCQPLLSPALSRSFAGLRRSRVHDLDVGVSYRVNACVVALAALGWECVASRVYHTVTQLWTHAYDYADARSS
jgi:hypothetical protein